MRNLMRSALVIPRTQRGYIMCTAEADPAPTEPTASLGGSSAHTHTLTAPCDPGPRRLGNCSAPSCRTRPSANMM